MTTTSTDPFDGVKDFGDGHSVKDFAPGLPQVKRERLVGVIVSLEAALIQEDWKSDFGTSDFAVVRLKLANGERCSSLWGGRAVVDAIRKSIKHNEFPRVVVLDTAAGQKTGNMYFYLRKRQPDDLLDLRPESAEVVA